MYGTSTKFSSIKVRSKTNFQIFSTSTEHCRAAEPRAVRPGTKALPDWRLHCLQAGPVDPEAALLQPALRQPDHQAADPQVARAPGAHHLRLPSHPRDQEDGDDQDGRGKSRTSSRGNQFL